jgi:vacuolar iron transporter family protein
MAPGPRTAPRPEAVRQPGRGPAAFSGRASTGRALPDWLPFGHRLVWLPPEAAASDAGGETREHRDVVLTGIAGLIAGAFSMATGEYVSVSSQNELIGSEVRKEKLELQNHPVAEQRELAAMFRARGVDPAVAREVAAQISRNPDHALSVHVREELGVDPQDLPSPVTAAGASLVSFSAGALVPLIPYLAGATYLWLALACAALAAIVGGGAVSRLTSRPFIRGAARQLLLGALAAALTYGIGYLVGGSVG